MPPQPKQRRTIVDKLLGVPRRASRHFRRSSRSPSPVPYLNPGAPITESVQEEPLSQASLHIAATGSSYPNPAVAASSSSLPAVHRLQSFTTPSPPLPSMIPASTSTNDLPTPSSSSATTLGPAASSSEFTMTPNPYQIMANPPSISARAPNVLDKAKMAGAVGFEGLVATLRVLRDCADWCPPLKSVVGGLLACIDAVGQISQNKEDFAELDRKLQAIVAIVAQHQNVENSQNFNRRLDNFVRVINDQMELLQSKGGHGYIRRFASGSKHAGDIIKSFRLIVGVFDNFQIDSMLSIEQNTEGIQRRNEDILLHVLFTNLPRVKSAPYNASSAVPRGACTKDTRQAILSEIMSWASDTTRNSIYWLNGMAGTGKTTISYSVSENLDQSGLLGASFFCSRAVEESTKVDRILPTIAYDLARRFPSIAIALLQVLKSDPDAGNRRVKHQFKELVTRPIVAAAHDLDKSPVIVIDALDECSNQQEVQDLLHILLNDSQNIPMKFFITSRPEQVIQRKFNRVKHDSYSRLLLHNVEKHVVDADIRSYLIERLVQITEGRSDFDSKDCWPPVRDIDVLVRRANKLFIFAATACGYIGGPGGNIRRRLVDVTSISAVHPSTKTKDLDALYIDILKRVYAEITAEERLDIQQVLGAVICIRDPLSISGLGTLLGTNPLDVKSSLASLHSVIHVPPGPNSRISTFHASFPDFVTDRDRSREFALDAAQCHRALANRCLDVLNSLLRENICGLEGQSRNMEVTSETIEQRIPEGLRYSCIYWASHLVAFNSDVLCDKGGIQDLLNTFLNHHILHWFECLSILGRLEVSVESLYEVERWILNSHPHLLASIIDARRFAQENFELIHGSYLETYRSALVWLPIQSLIRQHEATRYSHLPKVVAGLRESWDACEKVIQGQNSVKSVAFSGDGIRIVSGSYDETVRIWNAKTGESEGFLEGHSDSVNSVGFSSDGYRIVSGSDDLTVRIWNARTGESERVLEGHSDWVRSVAFSSDGGRVVSGSDDRTVRIWNAITGLSEGVLEGHSNSVKSVAFSSDGNCIVSGSDDRTVHIWNISMGHAQKVLQGHMSPVNSVVFSCDGCRVVSGSDDRTVRIWNARTGQSERVLQGHSSTVNSVMFSRDGTCVVSGSDDRTVRVWNARTGQVESILEGHSSPVYSVAFSCDGIRIVSGSDDRTVRVWNARTGKSDSVLKGHSSSVNFVVFSGDGTRVVSGSDDCTARIWNTATGQSEGVLEGHSSSVNSAEFSADGIRVISGSSDRKVHIWNASTGQSEGLLEGHLSPVWSVAFSNDGSRVVSGSSDGTVRIWNISTGQLEGTLVGHSNGVNSVMFSGDGNHVVSGSYDRTLRIWKTTTGESEGILEGHSDWVRSVAFSGDGSRIVSASNDRTVQIWNATTMESEGVLEGHSDGVNSVAFSDDANCVVSGSDDLTVRIWNVQTRQLESVLKGHSLAVNSVAFSCDGNRVASGSDDRTIRIWNAREGQLEDVLRGHLSAVWSVAFSCDGCHIVSGSDDRTVRIWNTMIGQLEHVLEGHSSPVWSVAFSRDGSRIVSGSDDWTVCIWDLKTGEDTTLPWMALPDGSEVQHCGDKGFHIASAHPKIHVQQAPVVYSISDGNDWILERQHVAVCWIPPTYRDYKVVKWDGSSLCLGYASGHVVIVHCK